jgi:hypothetical protein
MTAISTIKAIQLLKSFANNPANTTMINASANIMISLLVIVMIAEISVSAATLRINLPD